MVATRRCASTLPRRRLFDPVCSAYVSTRRAVTPVWSFWQAIVYAGLAVTAGGTRRLVFIASIGQGVGALSKGKAAMHKQDVRCGPCDDTLASACRDDTR